MDVFICLSQSYYETPPLKKSGGKIEYMEKIKGELKLAHFPKI